MKKTFLLILTVAALAITACSKKENEPHTPKHPTHESGLAKTDHYNVGTSLCFSWYDDRLLGHIPDGCEVQYMTDSLCYIEVGCDDGEEIYLAVDQSYPSPDNMIRQIRIPNYSSLPSNLAQWLAERINIGNIVLVHDSPIGDTEVLALCAQDYIPAGTYSIVNDGGDAVIIL